MRILIPVIDFGRSGGYRVLSSLATEWNKSVDTRFIAPHNIDAPYFPTTARVTHIDVFGRAVKRGSAPGAGARRVLSAQASLAMGLRRHLLPGDVVVSNHFLTVYAANLARRDGVTHVRLMQATEADYYPGSSVRARLMRWLATRADALAPAVLSNSEAFLEGDPRRIAVVPPGIDLTVFGRRGPGAHGKAVVGTLGRKEPWKGTDRVLRAIRDGGLAADVSVHVADFGFDLSPFADLNIEAVRPANDSELAEWYRGLDFYVVGAYGQEGAYHYPCLEAMASGVCLITPWYRPADAAVAWLVPSSDPKELAPAIRAAIHSPADRRVRINAARRRAEDFSWPGIAARALAALEKAAGGAGVPSAIQGRTSRAAKTH